MVNFSWYWHRFFPCGAVDKRKWIMDATTKASILHGMIRRLGAGGADITLKDWLDFVQAQNDDYRTGPAIGEKVPQFALADQHGQIRTLNDLMGTNGMLLVFSRSADW
jgi:hypothetical protein